MENFNRSAKFQDVQIGQAFVEALSPFNHVFHRCNELVHDGSTVNARRLVESKVIYKRFSDWEPVFIEGKNDP